MKISNSKSRIATWVICAGFCAFDAVPSRADTWETVAPMPTARAGLAAAASGDGNLIYALGGNTSTAPAVDTAEVYNVRDDSWTAIPPIPVARQYGAAASLFDELICVFGGLDPNGTILSRTDCYDPGAGQWFGMPIQMTTARLALAGAASLDHDKIYAVGGTNISSTFRTVEMLRNQLRVWTTVAPMGTARQFLAAATGSDDRIYVFGGIDENNVTLSSAEAYDPRLDRWDSIPSMQVARRGLAAASNTDHSKIYVAGGVNDLGFISFVEVFDVPSQTWSSVDPMPTARSWLAAATGPRDRIIAIGGRRTSTWLDTVEVYAPSGSSSGWSGAPPMDVGRQSLAATTGLDGKIYVLGGFRNDTGDQRVVERFDPVLGEWSSIAPMHTARRGLAATTGQDGRIYAIGGFNPDVSEHGHLKTLEIYDPSVGLWIIAAPLPQARSFLGAAAGSDGTIYAFGGCLDAEGDCDAVDDVWAYDPISDRWTSREFMEAGQAFMAVATGSDGKIYSIGGQNNTGELDGAVQAYDPPRDSWSRVTTLPTPRAGLAAATRSDGTIYTLGGFDDLSTFLDTVEAYNPSTDTWSTIDSMPTARRDLAAAAGVDFGIGRIFAFGGAGVEFPLATVEVYTPP